MDPLYNALGNPQGDVASTGAASCCATDPKHAWFVDEQSADAARVQTPKFREFLGCEVSFHCQGLLTRYGGGRTSGVPLAHPDKLGFGEHGVSCPLLPRLDRWRVQNLQRRHLPRYVELEDLGRWRAH